MGNVPHRKRTTFRTRIFVGFWCGAGGYGGHALGPECGEAAGRVGILFRIGEGRGRAAGGPGAGREVSVYTDVLKR